MKNKNNSPLNSESGKWGQRDPGTGYSQKEKLSDRAGHSKAVSEGYNKALPLIGSVVGAMAPIPGAGLISKAVPALGRTAKAFSNAAKQYLSRPVSKLAPKKYSRPNIVNSSNIKYNIGRPSNYPASHGMSTPLTPKFTPKTPRGHETITLKGGRKMTKPGTPGHSRNIGGKKTYSAKDPLWPKEIDKGLYPKNWK